MSVFTGAIINSPPATSPTLQNAYNGGSAIVVTAANPVTISNAATVASNLLALTEAYAGSSADYGLTWSRSVDIGLANTYTGGAIRISSTPTHAGAGKVFESGVLLSISHVPTGSAGKISDTTTGISLTMTPISPTGGGAATLTGFSLTMGSLCEFGSKALIVTDNCVAASPSDAVQFILGGTTGSGRRCVLIQNTATYTSGAVGQTLLRINNSPTNNSGGTVVSNLTVMSLTHAPVATAGITDTAIGFSISMAPANSGTPSCAGLTIAMNATAATAAVQTGLTITVSATTAAAAALQAALVIDSQATLARVFDCAIANTAGTAWHLRYRAATNIAAAGLDAVVINLTTNVTAGANAVRGVIVNSPLGGSNGNNCGLTVAQTTDAGTGLFVSFFPNAAGTAVTGILSSLGANASAAGSTCVTATAASAAASCWTQNTQQVFAGTGAPNNANGANGDLYWDKAGAPATVPTGTMLYVKVAGVWGVAF